MDYAGLFPPAKLNLKEAIANYAQYQQTHNNWLLGRFVIPVSRLTEIETLLADRALEKAIAKAHIAIALCQFSTPIVVIIQRNKKDTSATT